MLSEMQVESIVLSIISMLSSPNDESPANIEAAVSAHGITLSLSLSLSLSRIGKQTAEVLLCCFQRNVKSGHLSSLQLH